MLFSFFKVTLIAVCLISLSSFVFAAQIGYAANGNHDKSDALSNQIESTPSAASIMYFFRGLYYVQIKQYDLAVADYTKIIELEPEGAIPYYYRAYSYSELGKYDLALHDCNKAISIEPNAEFYSERGYVEWKKELFSDSIDDFTKAIELEPNTAFFYVGRGNAYGCMEKYNEAIKDFQKAIQLNPKEGMAYFNLAQAYELLGEKKRSLVNYQEASKFGVSELSEVDQAKIKARLNGNWSKYIEWI